MPSLVLYSGTKNASSWAMRAWLALKHAGLDFEEVVVDIRRPQRLANLGFIARLSPSATVPLLMVDHVPIFDSAAIMEFANDRCGGALLPNDQLDRARARSLLAWQHSGLSGICARISFESSFYPLRTPLSAQEQLEADRLFGFLENLLVESGGPFLFGALSLADLILVPSVVRLGRHEVDLSTRPASKQWAQRILSDSHVQEWLQVAECLPHIWFDQYLPDPVPAAWQRIVREPDALIEPA